MGNCSLLVYVLVQGKTYTKQVNISRLGPKIRRRKTKENNNRNKNILSITMHILYEPLSCARFAAFAAIIWLKETRNLRKK